MNASEMLQDGSSTVFGIGAGTPERAPTHALRHRAFANEYKALVLKEEHDPLRDQESELGRARRRAQKQARRDNVWDVELRPALAFQERTVCSWWRGGVERPHDKGIALCERLAKGSSRWLDYSRFGSAIQRHLDALDVRCDDRLLVPFRLGTEEWMSPRLASLDKCMTVADRCWSVFTNIAEPDPDTLGLAARMGPSGVMPAPTFSFRSQLPANWLSEDRINTYVFDVHPSVRHLHTSTDRFGLLKCLFRLGVLVEDPELRPWWFTGLVFDLASCVSMALIFALFGPRWSPAANVGDAWPMIDTLNRVIFDEEKVALEAAVTRGPELAAMMHLPPQVVVSFLRSARDEYYRQLAAVGISFRDVFSITNPELAAGSPIFVRVS